ncbi:MAG: helix-turn-helix transcriptional regulator [Allosphingosinicella sp.]
MKKSTGWDWATRFQDAALDPAQWLPALQDLADATGSARAELIGLGENNFLFNWVTSIDPCQIEQFAALECHSPGTNYRVATGVEAELLEVVHEAHYDHARQLLVRDDYLDFCEQFDMPFGCQTNLLRDAHSLVGLSVLRSRADGRTSEAQRRAFADAAPYVRTAVRMQRAIEHQGFSLLHQTLEAMSLPCFLLDGLGEVRSMTPAAEKLLGEGSSLRLVDRRIGGRHGDAGRQIELAIRAVLGPDNVGHQRVPLFSSSAVPDLVLDMFRLPARDWAMHFAARAIVVVRDPRPELSGGAKILAGAFGLTPAEAQVALGLCAGHGRERIAVTRGVSLETLRAQVKSIYLKTGCSREAELVLLLKALLD